MKNVDLYRLHKWLERVSKLWWARFSYAVSKNKNIILDELKTLEESKWQTDSYKEYEKKRIELCELHSEKDWDWKAIIENNIYKIVNYKKFNKELEDLRTEHKEAIDEQKTKDEEYEKLMQEETEIEFFEIKRDILPEEMTSELLDPFFELIEK